MNNEELDKMIEELSDVFATAKTRIGELKDLSDVQLIEYLESYEDNERIITSVINLYQEAVNRGEQQKKRLRVSEQKGRILARGREKIEKEIMTRKSKYDINKLNENKKNIETTIARLKEQLEVLNKDIEVYKQQMEKLDDSLKSTYNGLIASKQKTIDELNGYIKSFEEQKKNIDKDIELANRFIEVQKGIEERRKKYQLEQDLADFLITIPGLSEEYKSKLTGLVGKEMDYIEYKEFLEELAKNVMGPNFDNINDDKKNVFYSFFTPYLDKQSPVRKLYDEAKKPLMVNINTFRPKISDEVIDKIIKEAYEETETKDKPKETEDEPVLEEKPVVEEKPETKEDETVIKEQPASSLGSGATTTTTSVMPPELDGNGNKEKHTIQELMDMKRLPKMPEDELLAICNNMGIPAKDFSYALSKGQFKALLYDSRIQESKLIQSIDDRHEDLAKKYEEIVERFDKLLEKIDREDSPFSNEYIDKIQRLRDRVYEDALFFGRKAFKKASKAEFGGPVDIIGEHLDSAYRARATLKADDKFTPLEKKDRIRYVNRRLRGLRKKQNFFMSVQSRLINGNINWYVNEVKNKQKIYFDRLAKAERSVEKISKVDDRIEQMAAENINIRDSRIENVTELSTGDLLRQSGTLLKNGIKMGALRIKRGFMDTTHQFSTVKDQLGSIYNAVIK